MTLGKGKLLLVLILFLLSMNPLLRAGDAKTESLTVEQKKWLDEVHWIISDYERNAFMRLEKSEDRDRFIQEFWDSRDPTPGTARNEFQEEHMRRFEYANKFYGRDTTLPGWKTDRGRVYILLGKPRFLNRNTETDLQPMELWQYVGLREYDLPPSLYLIFFRKNGVGPYRLYSPLFDGIRALFEHRNEIEEQSDEELYNWMQRRIDPEIAHAALSYIPSEGGWFGFQGKETGSLGTEVVISKLDNARNYQAAKREYVEEILSHRPSVKVYYTIEGGGVQDGLYWSVAPNGHCYLDYAVEYEPNKLEMGQYEDEYYTSLTLDGQISDSNQGEIDQITGTHDIRLDSAQFAKVKEIPFQFEGRRPIVPGKFGLTLILVNNVSRQAVTFAHDLYIPDMAADKVPYITPLIPIRSLESAPKDDHRVRPFQFGDSLYVPNLPAHYSTGVMNIYHQVLFPDHVRLGPEGVSLRYVVRKADSTEAEFTQPITIPTSKLVGQVIDVQKEISLKNLDIGNKELWVEVRQGEKVLAKSAPLPFSVGEQPATGVWKFSVALPGYDSPFHLATLAQQYMKLNKPKEAQALWEEAYGKNPESLTARLPLMRSAMKDHNYDRVLELGSPLEVENPRDQELIWLMGWGNYGKGNYEDAVRFFERLRLENPGKVEVLNMLADSYYRLNQPTKSLERLEESLKLNPDQKDMLDLKQRLEANQHNPEGN